MSEDVDLDALAAQYRDARDAIRPHRVVQAKAEVAYAEALQRNGGDQTAVIVVQARAAVDKAVADVEWCKAVMVACGEAIKGEPLGDLMARNDRNRADVAAMRQRALAQLEGQG